MHLHLKCHYMLSSVSFQIILALHLVILVILYANFFSIISTIFFSFGGFLRLFHICPHFKEKLKWKMKVKIKTWAFIVRHLIYLETNFLARIAFRQLHTAVCCNFPFNFNCSNWPCQQAVLLTSQRSLGLLYLNDLIAKWDGMIHYMRKATLPLLLKYSHIQNTSWIK